MASSNPLKADGPLNLIPTPNSQTGKDDQFTQNASHMALVHNVMIRAYNSIYLQAPKLKAGDVPDFLHYCQAWHETVKGHHESEEEVLFPEIEKASGVKGIMDGDVEEHHAFYSGLDRFKSYLDACLASPSKFSGTELVEILDSFGPTLYTHLSHEPPKLASLSQYDIDMKAISEKTAQHSMQRSSTTDVLPLLWYNLDKEFENGKWADFPEVPAPIKWVMINILGWWRGNWWRFGSSGADGVQRELLCLRKEYGS